jgi:hypothetical protein
MTLAEFLEWEERQPLRSAQRQRSEGQPRCRRSRDRADLRRRDAPVVVKIGLPEERGAAHGLPSLPTLGCAPLGRRASSR